jgi:hypothetical protein
MTATTQQLNVVSCTPGPSGRSQTGKDWALYYLEVQDPAGNQLEGKYKCWNHPLEPGLREYTVETEHSDKYGTSHLLKPVKGSNQLPLDMYGEPVPETHTSSEGDLQKPIGSGSGSGGEMVSGTVAQAIAALVRRMDKLDERVTIIAKLLEVKEPTGKRFGDDEDIPF